jgi:hypothetical protein
MFSASKSGFELLQVMRLRRWTQNKGILKRWNIRAQRSQRVRKIREEAWTIAVILQDTRQEPATDLYDSERKHTRSTRNWSLSIHFREIHRFGHITAIDPRFVAHSPQQSPAIHRIPSSQRSIGVEQDLRVTVHTSVELVVSPRSFIEADLVRHHKGRLRLAGDDQVS